MPRLPVRLSLLASAAILYGASAGAQTLPFFTPGDLVVSSVQDSSSKNGGAALDTASPITLTEYALSGTGSSASASAVGTLVLPQTSNGVQSAISGEWGSASEGMLENSVNGQYLTIVGYGVNANTFNSYTSANTSPYGTLALGQTNSLTGQTTTTVPRVVALINGNGLVDTSTALTGVFNQNNPRSAATVDGSQIYVSGQGVTGDGTGGVFLANRGATTATAINVNTTGAGANTTSATVATETRAVEIVNTGSGNTLEVSRDFKVSGTPNDATDIRILTAPGGGLPTTSTGLVATRVFNTNTSTGESGNSRGGNTSSINLGATTTSTTSALNNGVNNGRDGKFVYLSPEQFYYANATTLYVADSGSPKNGSPNTAQLGEGGLQKWSLVGGVWTLDYDIYLFNDGLSLANNANANSGTPTAAGITGLFGLACQQVGLYTDCYATTYGLNELSASYLVGVSDLTSNTDASTGSGEVLTVLESGGTDSNGNNILLRGVAFAPVPEPASPALFGVGAAAIGLIRRRRR